MKINQVPSSMPIEKSSPAQTQRSYEPTKTAAEPAKIKLDPEVMPVNPERVDAKPKGALEEIKEQQEDVLEQSVKQANKSLKQFNRYIEREVHEVTHTVMYTLRDSITNEVISEFPPRKIQDMIAKMWELAGLFVDEKA